MSVGINIITDHAITAENLNGLLSRLDSAKAAMHRWEETVCHDGIHAQLNWRWAWSEDFTDPVSYWNKGNTLTAFLKDGASIRFSKFAAVISVPAIWSFVMQNESYIHATRELGTEILRVIGGSSMLVVPSSSAYCAEGAVSNLDSQLTFDAILKAYKECMARNKSSTTEDFLLWGQRIK